MKQKSLYILPIACALTAIVACGPKNEPMESTEAAPPVEEVAPASDMGPIAVATLIPRGEMKLGGTVTFKQAADHVKITAFVEGVTPGSHGFHIHQVGDCSAEDFTSAGGHFNPSEVPHGAPSDLERHAGDLGNIEVAANGEGTLEIESDLLTVDAGPSSVVGRAVILHEDPDDMVTQPTGAAGGRIACGVIALEGDSPAAY